MKHLMTLVALLVSTAAVAQIPNYLPYNPDSDGDYFISLPDLLELLVVYGSEWENGELILSEDTTSALLYVGERYKHLCLNACSSLSGPWQVASMSDYILHFEHLENYYEKAMVLDWSSRWDTDVAWLRKEGSSSEVSPNVDVIPANIQGFYVNPNNAIGVVQEFPLYSSQFYSGTAATGIEIEDLNYAVGRTADCWCAVKQVPRVEYHIVPISGLSIEEAEEAFAVAAAAGWIYLEMDQNIRAIFWRFAQ